MPPALITLPLITLILSQLFYAFWPYRQRTYPAVLLATLAGMALGQIWLVLGLPALGLGEADFLPGALFAAALQPLAGRLPIRWGS
ncbi:MAG TPA: hypothetical protein VNI34_10195 [Candidatus Nitrosotalea sp.]|nr:hypothetical protein [Candidatus Nitrosotalea sp.]